MAPPRGLVIVENEIEPMDLTVCSFPFTGYLPTSKEIKFCCVKQLPMPILDLNFFRQNLLGRKSVPWTANWTLSFPEWRSPEGSCIFPMTKDKSYNKDDGEAFMFRSVVGNDVRIHAFGIVTLPVVLYGVALSIQCLLVDRMYFIPLAREIEVPLILDARLFNGRRLPLKLTIFKPAFVVKRGKPDLCLVWSNSPEKLTNIICISVVGACVEYGEHLEEEMQMIRETYLEEEEEFDPSDPEYHEPDRPKFYEKLMGQSFSGAGVFFSPNSQFNTSRRLDDDVNTPERAQLQAAIEGMKCLRNLTRFTGYNFRTAVILTESSYVCRATKDPGTVLEWAMRGWKTESGEDIENKDLWQDYLKNVDPYHRIDWQMCERNSRAPAAVLARRAALENILLAEGPDDERNERERNLPSQFFEVRDDQAGPLYDDFLNISAEETTSRISAVVFEAGVCAEDLPKGFYIMVDCGQCRKVHSHIDRQCPAFKTSA
ncbi:hypothetical protein TWF481_006401 [Arthrobotrys musiformis]|uniref:RNase H type-1 domain-containing protein n=1 Tax=Arthrobotrys musiformis TaxID=47236 RepID=A0AAV9WHQ7_9PEZI